MNWRDLLGLAPVAGSVAGGIVGTALGPGVGTAAGASVGGALGGLISGANQMSMDDEARKKQEALLSAQRAQEAMLAKKAEELARKQAVNSILSQFL